MEKPSAALEFLLTVNEVIETSVDNAEEHFKDGFKLIAVRQYKDCDGLAEVSLIVGRHNPNLPY